MKYYKNTETGEVFAYETEDERNEWGAPELVEMAPEEIDEHLNPPAAPAEPRTILSSREYLSRFTMAEYAAVRTGPVPIQYALDNLIGAQFVDLNDPDVAAGLDAMVAAGIIDEARKAELLEPA